MKCLIVEDDPTLSAQLAAALRDGGFTCDIAADGTQGEFLGSTETYDLAILDLGLPGMPGIEVLTRWREGGATMPVLILTARGDWTDKVAGFRAGADDYAVKPFRLEEVVIRAQTLVRRAAGHAQAVIKAGPLRLDTQLGVITRNGLALKLTAFETRILAYLIHHQNRVVSRSELSDHLYDSAADRDFKSIEVVIGRLRKKVGEGLIETRRGEGYVLRTAA
ncbi:response regulator transcription factor [Paracoccus versutus]|uniref:Two-component system OmpR family response regulator n=1 Tax=Paracoccus versutus TaxID=34007 RepID=A0A3D9XJ22_PARVE|nr:MULTISPECIES: response regulator transcription factor [Paracoccus]WGR59775.1 response regulator transcription factor [Paracoccus ferrooxidans]SFY22064.1 two-component system, OmpR family, response regulator [Paracoccus pantotrophus]KGJ11881.1 transcriptional regulator [Paracoccus versutus]MBT0778498.1 response regulator transcription factor [Paracoccus sp. pheM1]MCJ1900356.1 response regulator transcription factor [Paracoccus versutus]